MSTSTTTTSTITGTPGNDALLGTSGNDLIDGGGGSDVINAGSGNDTMIFRLSANADATDLYLAGSGVDTVLLQLTQAEWTNTAVRAELQRYTSFLSTVSRNSQGEVSASGDFTFQFPNASTLKLSMVEQLAISVQNTSGQYVPIDYLASVISGPITGSVLEAGGTANATAGVPSVTGDLYADDFNGPDDAFKAVVTPANASYGTYTVTSAGLWTYTLNNANSNVQALSAGALLTDTFTVSTLDGTSQIVTVNITGANDAPVAVADTAAGTENQILTLDVLANDTDVDTGHVFTLVSVAAPAGKGAATVVGNKLVFDPGTAFDHLAQGVTEAVTVSYTMRDELGATSSSTEKITITGTNDAPVATFTAAKAATEDGAIVTGQLTSTDLDDGATATYALAGAAIAGLTLGANGAWSFDPSNAAYQHLAKDASQPVVVGYNVSDGKGGTGSASFTINVTGANDAPVATFTAAQPATEDGAIVTGQLTSTDRDDGATATYALAGAAIAGLTLGANGAWSFDPSNDAYQHLAQGGPPQAVAVAYNVSDGKGGTGSASFTINVAGTNDAPVATFTAAQPATEDGAIVTGQLTSTDRDDGASATYALAGPIAGLTLDANGAWSFDPSNAAYQHLAQGDPAQAVKVTYNVSDDQGSTGQASFTINVAGANDAPMAFPDTAAGTENQILTLDVLANDTDADANHSFTLVSASLTNGSKGSLSVDSNQLVFDPGTDFDHLAEGAIDTVTLNYTMKDDHGATSSSTETITITGTNDAPVITPGPVNQIFQESNAGFSSSGTITFTDPDDGAVLSVRTSATRSSDQIHNFASVGSNGNLINWGIGMQSPDFLQVNDSATVAMTITVTDGHGGSATQTESITVNGTNDPAVITGTSTVKLTETDAVLTASGNLSATDVDSSPLFVAQTGVAGNNSYGTFTISAAGAWSYTANSAHDEFVAGTTYTDSITVATADGTTQPITVSILGTADTAVITGTSTGSVLEAGGVNNATLNTPTVSGTLSCIGQDFHAVDAGTATTYGSYGITAAGVWTYTLDNANPTVDALNVPLTAGFASQLTDTFTVKTMDGTEQVVNVTIDGANDDAVITTLQQPVLAVFVDNYIYHASFAVTSTDVDNGRGIQNATDSNGTYGTYSVSGNFVLYNATFSSPADGTMDHIKVYSEDGTEQTIAVTMVGNSYG